MTAGGRVLAVTAVGQNLKGSIERAYKGTEKVQFEGRHLRTDIGKKALARISGGPASS